MNKPMVYMLAITMVLILWPLTAKAQENTVDINISTNKEDADILMSYFKNNDYEIKTETKSQIVVRKKISRPDAAPTTLSDKVAAYLENPLFGKFAMYGVTGGALLLGLIYVVGKLIAKRREDQEEYYYDTYQEHPYNETTQATYSHTDLASRLRALNAQPQFSMEYGVAYQNQTPAQMPVSNWMPHLTNNNQCSMMQQLQGQNTRWL